MTFKFVKKSSQVTLGYVITLKLATFEFLFHTLDHTFFKMGTYVL